MRMLLDDVLIGAAVTGAAGRNELLRSDAVNTSPWVAANGPVITTGLSDAPNGTSTAMLMREAATSAHCNIQQPLTVSAGQLVTFSISVKKYASSTSKRYLSFWLYQPGTTGLFPGVVIDPENGTLPFVGAHVLGYYVEPQNSGWWRLSVVVASAMSGTVYVRFDARSEAYKLTLAGGTVSGDNTSGVLLWRPGAGLVGGPVGPLLTTTAAVAGDGWLSTLPPSNVLLGGKARVARSAGASGGVVFTADMAATAAVNTVVLGDHNLGVSALWAVELWSGTGATGTLVGYVAPGLVTDGLISIGGRGLSAVYLAEPVQARSIRITITDRNNAAGYVQVGRLMAGQYIKPTYGLAEGCSVYWTDLGMVSRQYSGALLASVGARFKVLTGDLALLSESERATLHKAFYAVGTARDVFVSVWPGNGAEKERDHQIIGKFTSLPKLKADSTFAYSAPFEVSES